MINSYINGLVNYAVEKGLIDECDSIYARNRVLALLKLDDYKDLIIHKVDTYGCTAMAVYKFIEKKGYTGKYSIVADFVKRHMHK